MYPVSYWETDKLYDGPNVKNLVKFKGLKDRQTGTYKEYRYPDYAAVAFNTATDKYPYPIEAIDVTYNGLHPADKGYEMIRQGTDKNYKEAIILVSA